MEPLGEGWEQEVRNLRAAQQAADHVVRTAQSNMDEGTAQLRNDLAYVQRTHASLPPGPGRQQLQQAAAELRQEAESLAQGAQLPPTTVRAGKQERTKRQRELRSEGDRVVKRLLTRGKPKPTLRQQRHQPPEAISDPLPKAAKKGRPVTRVRTCRAGWQGWVRSNVHGLQAGCR